LISTPSLEATSYITTTGPLTALSVTASTSVNCVSLNVSGTATANTKTAASGQELQLRSNASGTTNIRCFTSGIVAVNSILTNHIGTQLLILCPAANRDLALQRDTGTQFLDAIRVNRASGDITISNNTTCSGQLFVTGTKFLQTTSRGVLMGTESNGNASIEIITDTNGIAYIDFSQVNTDFKGRILYNNSTDTMTFHIAGSTTARMTLNSTGYSAAGTKSFDIPNEHKGGNWRLRHRCIEAAKALNVYRLQLTLPAGETRQALPAYHSWLNTNYQVWISAYKHFGIGWGDVEAVDGVMQLVVNVNQAGQYNILIVADRDDQVAVDEFNQYGVEYEGA
jgi:hypothetical protein